MHPHSSFKTTHLLAALFFAFATAVQAQTWNHDGHTYQLTSAEMDWHAAEAEAVAAGGHLIAIGSQAEQDFVMNTIMPAAGLTTRPVWIGFSDHVTEGHFQWSNGEPAVFTKWHSGQPNNSNGDQHFTTVNWHRALSASNPAGTWADNPVAGTTTFGGTTNGPYFGIIEIGLAQVPAPVVWNGGTGLWTNPAMWSTGAVPNAGSDAIIDDESGTASIVTLDNGNAWKVGRLRIDSGDRLDLVGGRLIASAGTYSAVGEIMVNGLLSLDGASTLEAENGSLSLTGAGKVVFGGIGSTYGVTDEVFNSTTIEGSGRWGAYNTDKPRIVNNAGGVFNANATGLRLELFGRNFATDDRADDNVNAGVLKATNGGVLRLGQGNWVNDGGQIIAEGEVPDGSGGTIPSIVRFAENTEIFGGTISATNGGLLDIGGSGTKWKDLTVNGSTRVVSGGSLQVNGTITVNGTVSVSGPLSRIVDFPFPFGSPASPVTLQGSGEIVIDKDITQFNGDPGLGNSKISFWTIQDLTVRGRGSVGRYSGTDTPELINRGTFQADVDGQRLLMELKNLDNQSGGVLRAIDGGILRLNVDSTLSNTGGTIEALTSGRVEAALARIEGGLIRNLGGSIPLGGMTLVNPGAGMRLEGDLKVGLPTTSQTVRLVNGIENVGTLRVVGSSSSNYGRLYIGETASPTVTLSGGGEVVLGDPTVGDGSSQIYEANTGPYVLNNVDNTIRGFGRLGDANRFSLTFNNAADVEADVDGQALLIDVPMLNNGEEESQGALRAKNGGLLRLEVPNGLNNVNGLIEAETGGAVDFQWTTEVIGGNLQNNDGAFDLSYATIVNPGSGVLLQGPFTIDKNAAARFVGDIRNEGRVTIGGTGNSTELLIGRTGATDVHLTGGGQIVVNDPVIDASNGSILHGVANAHLYLDDQTLRGFGVVGQDQSTLKITNNHLITVDEPGKDLYLRLGGLTNSPGKAISATDGARLRIHTPLTTNTGAIILAGTGSTVRLDLTNQVVTGGSIESQAGGFLEFHSGPNMEGGAVIQNNGTTLLGEVSSERTLTGFANGGGQFNNPAAGIIRKLAAGNYRLDIPLEHQGTILTEGGWLSLQGGGTIDNGTINTSAGAQTILQTRPFDVSGADNVFDGAGKVRLHAQTLTLVDLATKIAASNFEMSGASTLAGPGLVETSGGLLLGANGAFGVNATISGARLVQLPGANGTISTTSGQFRLTNEATFDNQGTLNLVGQSGTTTITAEAGTLFSNSGTLTHSGPNSDNIIRGLFLNTGLIQVHSRTLFLEGATTFDEGEAFVALGAHLYVQNGGSLTLEGENTITGSGFTVLNSAPMNFEPGAKLSAETLHVQKTSSINGGELNITGSLKIKDTSLNTTVTDTLIALEEGSNSAFEASSGTLRLNEGASLFVAGHLEVGFKPTLTFNSTNPGYLITAPTGTLRFTDNATFDVPVTIQDGGMWNLAAGGPGRIVTLSRGGGFYGADFQSADPSFRWKLTGTEAFEFHETNAFTGGHIDLVNANVQLVDDTPQNSEDPVLNASRVHFQGVSAISGKGTISSTGLFFEGAELTISETTLTNSPFTGDQGTWSVANGSVSLANGAEIQNNGRLVIQNSVGSFVGANGTRFYNHAAGRLVHATATTTNFDIDFHNEGILEFAAGTVNFLKNFTGQGGLAASNGALVNIDCSQTPIGLLPGLLESLGANSRINLALPPGDITIPLNINGGGIVAAGGLNLVAAGGLNMVAAGAGNLVAAGGLNLVAAGGGNLIAKDSGTLVRADGGSLVAAGGGNIVAAGAGNLVAAGAGNLVAAGAGNLVAAGAGNLVAAGAGNLVAAGGGNLVAAGGGNLVAAGGGNLVAAGAGNRPALSWETPLPAPVALERLKDAPQNLDDLAGVPGLEALLASVAALNSNPNVGVLFVEQGGTARAENGGSIIAEQDGIIAGSGTFTGPGLVQSGGALLPGSSVGLLTWDGNLTVENGGVLEIEIGGVTAGTQYDVVNVSGAFTMNGMLSVRMLNGFGSSVQPTDVFDIVTAGSPITTGLVGTRVAAAGSYGSFAVQLVNGGTTLRLTDFQTVAPTFSNWAERYGLTGANAAWDADPNFNGIPNLLEYALGLDPIIAGGTGITTAVIEENGQKYLTLSYTKPTGADVPTDLIYAPQRASSLLANDWSASVNDVVPHSVAPGPGNLETVTVRSAHPMSGANEDFLRLHVTLQ